MPEALIAENVSARRGLSMVVNDVSAQARFGEVLAVIGPNGAGKSSLLKAMTGILHYTGSIRVHGRELRGMTPRERARAIAYVPQQSLLTSNLRVRDVVAQGRFAHTGGFLRQAADSASVIARALAEAQVESLGARAYNQLSGGEQRRVLLARGLATEARVLLLDEPTAGLDVASVLRFHALVRRLALRGLAVVSVLHDLTDVFHHADRALLLEGGRHVGTGAARELILSSEVERVYGVRVASAVACPFELLTEAR